MELVAWECPQPRRGFVYFGKQMKENFHMVREKIKYLLSRFPSLISRHLPFSNLFRREVGIALLKTIRISSSPSFSLAFRQEPVSVQSINNKPVFSYYSGYNCGWKAYEQV